MTENSLPRRRDISRFQCLKSERRSVCLLLREEWRQSAAGLNAVSCISTSRSRSGEGSMNGLGTGAGGVWRRGAHALVAGLVMALAGPAVGPAVADELTFQFTNPSFGGNPFNSNHLLAVANAQNDNERPSSASQQSQADQFVRLLQSRLLSALASQVSDAILGENAQPTGRIVYGTQTVEWETLLDSIRLTITEAETGSVTIIEIPAFGDQVG